MSDIVYALLAKNAVVRVRYWGRVRIILCYLITPISKQKTLGLQFSTSEFHVLVMWVGCFHPPLPMDVFAEEPSLRAAPTAQGVGTDPKDLGCFGGG